MALKKNFHTGTKYYYAKLEAVNYIKSSNFAGTLSLSIKDSEDSNYHVAQNNMIVFFDHNDTNYPFTIESLNVVGNNILQEAYNWLKANYELFYGWVDC